MFWRANIQRSVGRHGRALFLLQHKAEVEGENILELKKKVCG